MPAKAQGNRKSFINIQCTAFVRHIIQVAIRVGFLIPCRRGNYTGFQGFYSRYGFHGSSVRYVSSRAAEMLGKPPQELKLIVCHMGNGSSITAVDGGLSVDSSMGFTPLEGIPMGTRSGSIDPMICEFLVKMEGISISEVMDILNKKSGVLGVSGVSSDFRDIDQAAEAGNERAQTALEIFALAARKTIGSFAAVMGGCDAIVFTAGIGENNTGIRKRVCRNLEYMGFELDLAKNQIRGEEAVISTDASAGKILVIPTNEELVIALDTEAAVCGPQEASG